MILSVAHCDNDEKGGGKERDDVMMISTILQNRKGMNQSLLFCERKVRLCQQ